MGRDGEVPSRGDELMTNTVKIRIAEMVRGQRIADFKERMMLQVRVIQALAGEHYAGDVLRATEDIAPEFAEQLIKESK